MGLIIKEYDTVGGMGSATVQVLFDTGSTVSLVRRDIAEQIGYVVEIPAGPEQIIMADGTGTIDVSDEVSLRVPIGSERGVWFHFLVVDALAEEMIIGADFMQRWKIKLDPEQEDMSIDPRALYMRA